MATKKNLVERIRLFEREERVKKKIDWVRDHISEPVAMRKEIAKLLVVEFSNCIGCIIGIGDPKNSSVITNIVFSGRDLRYPGERKMRDVLESVALFDGPAVVTGHLAVCPSAG